MDPDYIFNPFTGHNVEEVKTVDGRTFERIMGPDGTVSIVELPSSRSMIFGTAATTCDCDVFKISGDTWTKLETRKEESTVNVLKKNSYNKGEHIVFCCNEDDLSVERILKTLSAIKGKLMMDIAPIHIKEIECSVTPIVRQNIIMASKKLKMYGKKRPIIARFDDYGNRLPDEIDLGTSQGITLKIIDPKEYGKFYFELKGIEFPSMDYKTDPYPDLPF